MRAQAHGFSAASGKLGALLATLVFGYGTNGGPMAASDIFIISGYFTLAGMVVTVLFVPDVTNVPLIEIDRRWSIDRRAAYGNSLPLPKDFQADGRLETMSPGSKVDNNAERSAAAVDDTLAKV